MRIPKIALVCALALTLISCASLLEKTGRLLDGSASAQEELALYRLPWTEGYTDAEGEEPDRGESGSVEVRLLRRSADGQEFIAIFIGILPTLRINGTPPDEDGGFYLTSLDFFCSSLMGWNEFTLDLSGAGVFRVSGGEASLKLTTPVEPASIPGGKIRREETRLAGGDALSALRNRQERIAALCQWMHSRQNVPRFRNGLEFSNYWKPVLLPEMLSPSERHPAWVEKDAQWSRGEDISWNSSYTQAMFPEDLWKVRDSGTLLRDWEEAADWIYLIYMWDDIFDGLSNEINLKVK
jgi:hypothetical protein